MNAWRRYLYLVLAALILGGCATSGQKFSETATTAATGPAPDMGRIYFYRTMLLGMAVQPEVKVNGEVVGRAVPNGFFYVDRKPGSYEITTTTEVERKLSLTLDKGQTRYVKLSLSIGFVVGHVYPELIDNDVATKEMASTRFVEK
jgi:hypothetical protein